MSDSRATPSSAAFGLVLSPYFLATREAPAMAALMLGSTIATLLPTPSSGDDRESVRRAVDQAPRFLRLLDAWNWSGALWRSHAVRDGAARSSCADGLNELYRRIESDEALAPLRKITRHAASARRAERTTTDRADSACNGFLDLLCADLLKGGADPGVSVPVVATLDRFAAEHGLIGVRGDAESLMQRLESKLAQRVFSFGLPILIRASGTVLGRLRSELHAELEALRVAIDAGFAKSPDAGANLRIAAANFASAFDRWVPALAGRDDEFGERIVPGYVSVSGVLLPVDAAIRSGRAAVAGVSGGVSGGVGGGSGAIAGGGEPGFGAGDVETVRTLIIRESRIKPAASTPAEQG